MNALIRAAAFSSLMEWPAFCALSDTEASLVITDLIEMQEDERLVNLHVAYQKLRERVGDDGLVSYARCLHAGGTRPKR